MAFNVLTAQKLLGMCDAIAVKKRSAIRTAIGRASMRKSNFVSNTKGTRIIFRDNAFYDTECLVTHNDKGDIVVAFRGSESEGLFKKNGVFKDWVTTDFDSKPIRYPLQPGPAVSVGKGRWVHRGFWNAYDIVRAEVHDAVSDFLREHKNDNVRIFTTGFSLGAALSIHAGVDLGKSFKKHPVRTYAFAAPRVGNNDFNREFAKNTKEAYTIVFNGDPVPRTPPIGPNLKFGNKRYQTAPKLVFITKKFEVKSTLPKAKLSLNMKEHERNVYAHALEQID